MKLYIAMIASVIAISGCKKDEDTGGDTSGAGGGGGGGGGGGVTLDGSCADLADSYCGCELVDDTMCAAYEASLEAYTSDQCDPTLDAWNAAGGCDSLGG